MKRFVRVPVAVMLLALGLLALPLCFIGLHVSSPFDGARLGPEEPFEQAAWQVDGILATPLQNTDDGLHKDDRIVAVDGISIETWVQALTSPDFKRPEWKVDQTVIYGVVRNETRLDVPVQLHAYPVGAILRTLGVFPFVVLAFQFVAVYIFWRRPDDPAARPLAMWASCASTLITTVSIGLQMTDLVGGVGFWLYKVATFGAFMVGVP
jgi:two-component system, NarL family, sensor kinase